jgi:hypothetical protein
MWPNMAERCERDWELCLYEARAGHKNGVMAKADVFPMQLWHLCKEYKSLQIMICIHNKYKGWNKSVGTVMDYKLDG